MKVAFFGDIHGQVYHLLAAVIAWQKHTGTTLDLVIQVGDFGAERLEKMTKNIDVFLRYPANNPAEFDFLRVLYAQNHLATRLREIRHQLQQPIYFLRGDHDEVEWLRQFSQGTQNEMVPVDPFDLFHYVPDGTILEWGGMKFAFFGGVEHPGQGKEGSEHDPASLSPCWTPAYNDWTKAIWSDHQFWVKSARRFPQGQTKTARPLANAATGNDSSA